MAHLNKIILIILVWPSICFGTSLPIVCGVDAPISATDEIVILKSWLGPSQSNKSIQLKWKVSGGKLIKKNGQDVAWSLENVKPGIYKATVNAGTANIGECAVNLIVERNLSDVRGNERGTGLDFLSADKNEKKGYGLYSYLLLGERAHAKNNELYRSIINACLDFPSAQRIENFFGKSKTNVVYIPLLENGEKISKSLENTDRSGQIDLILEHYDYARARFILSHFGNATYQGPYFASSLNPINPKKHELQKPFLFQDMSNIPPHLSQKWAQYFLARTAQNQFWDSNALTVVKYEVRKYISILASAVPVVIDGMQNAKKWISVIN